MNLSQAKIGSLVKILNVDADLKLKCHLYNLGICPKTQIYVKQNGRAGGMFVVKGVLLGIKESISKLILVEPVCKEFI